MATVSSHRVTVGETASSNSRMFLIGSFLILARNDRHEILDEFEIWSDSTMDYGVSCPSAYKKTPKQQKNLIIDKTMSSYFLQYFSSPEPKAHR